MKKKKGFLWCPTNVQGEIHQRRSRDKQVSTHGIFERPESNAAKRHVTVGDESCLFCLEIFCFDYALFTLQAHSAQACCRKSWVKDDLRGKLSFQHSYLPPPPSVKAQQVTFVKVTFSHMCCWCEIIRFLWLLMTLQESTTNQSELQSFDEDLSLYLDENCFCSWLKPTQGCTWMKALQKLFPNWAMN